MVFWSLENSHKLFLVVDDIWQHFSNYNWNFQSDRNCLLTKEVQQQCNHQKLEHDPPLCATYPLEFSRSFNCTFIIYKRSTKALCSAHYFIYNSRPDHTAHDLLHLFDNGIRCQTAQIAINSGPGFRCT